MNMTGIIFSEVYNNNLDALTYDRNMGAIPFGGRYRLVDFALSNMVNSGITNIGVLAKQHYHSLMDHLSKSQEWDLNRKNGGLILLPPFANEGLTQVHRGKLDELHNALDYLTDATSDYVLLVDANAVYSADFSDILKSHIESGCDITYGVTTAECTADAPCQVVLQADPGHRATAVLLNYVPKDGDSPAVGLIIMSRRQLIQVVQEYTARGVYHLERDFIQREFNKGRLTINTYPLSGTVLRIRSIPEYFRCNLSLTDAGIADSMFHAAHPVFTRVHDEVPTYYGKDCQVSDCLLADGCIIEGSVEHCVLSRGVRVGKGATVKDCIIMQGCVIGEGVHMENVIVDKWSTITDGSELKGTLTAPITIRKGVTV